MKNIIKSLAIVVAVAAIAGGATWAAYHEEASLTGSTFSASSMDLKIDANPLGNADYWWESTIAAPALFGSPLGSNKVKPGSTGQQVLDILNQGDVDGNATIKLHVVADTPLYHSMNFKVSFDGNHDGTFETVAGNGPLTAWNNVVFPLGQILGNSADGIPYGKISSVKIEWSVPSDAGNEIMGSNVVIDTVFGLDSI